MLERAALGCRNVIFLYLRMLPQSPKLGALPLSSNAVALWRPGKRCKQGRKLTGDKQCGSQSWLKCRDFGSNRALHMTGARGTAVIHCTLVQFRRILRQSCLNGSHSKCLHSLCSSSTVCRQNYLPCTAINSFPFYKLTNYLHVILNK